MKNKKRKYLLHKLNKLNSMIFNYEVLPGSKEYEVINRKVDLILDILNI